MKQTTKFLLGAVAVVAVSAGVAGVTSYALMQQPKQNETVENLVGAQDGKEDGFFKKTLNGAWKKFVYALPIIGTYQLGKNKIAHENLKNRIEAAKNGTSFEPETAGGFKAFFTGVGEKIKNIIPFYGTYYRGKMMNENENMYKDSQIIAIEREIFERELAEREI